MSAPLSFWCTLSFGVAIAGFGAANAAHAQSAVEPARSTKAGVYTNAQALRGRETYAGLCASCHPAVTHSGPAFAAKWNTRPLSDLFGFIRENMPKTEPGSLTPKEYADVLAYMLKVNGNPAGRAELTADSVAMTRVKIDLGTPP